jgi:hypothetical protein
MAGLADVVQLDEDPLNLYLLLNRKAFVQTASATISTDPAKHSVHERIVVEGA